MLKRLISFTLSLLFALSLAIMPVQAEGFTATIQALVWSPDSQALAYATKEGLFVVDLDGNQQRIADVDPLNMTLAWSGDGQALLATQSVGDQAQIYQFPLSGEPGIALTERLDEQSLTFVPGNFSGSDPVTSPDGQSIAFLAFREGDSNLSLYVMAADGSDQRRLPTPPQRIARPFWSPDSQVLAFVTQPGQALGDLYAVNRDGSGLTQVTDSGDVDSYQPLTWLRDQIAFCRIYDQSEQIELRAIDSSEHYAIWRDGRAPAISPDGLRVLLVALGSKWGYLTLMRFHNGGATTLQLPGERAYYEASWSPDGMKIAFVTHRFDDPQSEDIVVTQLDGSQPQVLVSLKLK